MTDEKTKYTVVMVRHGQSEANLLNVYSGWDDALLTEEGINQAKRAGNVLKNAGYKFDVAHTSLLTRAQKTLEFILEELGQPDISVHKTWRLNERHLGDFVGLTQADVIEKFGQDKIHPFSVPPPMSENHPYYEKIRRDPRYKDGPTPEEFPASECLELAVKRLIPHWKEIIVPQLLEDKKVLIVSYSSLLKGLAWYLEGIPKDEVSKFSIPNATPFVYKLDQNLKPAESLKYVGNR